MNQWVNHIDFKGPGYSGPSHLNLLSQIDRIYLMDNHKMALWCWAKQLTQAQQSKQKYSLFHLDAHYDTDPKLLTTFPTLSFSELGALSLLEYLKIPSLAWDNYLPVMLQNFQEGLGQTISCTHKIGIPWAFDLEIEPWDLLKVLDKLIAQSPHPWIINLDIDFFFARSFKRAPMFHPEWMKRFWDIIAMNYDDGKISVMTVALSPECSGSWEMAMLMWQEGEKALGITPFPWPL